MCLLTDVIIFVQWHYSQFSMDDSSEKYHADVTYRIMVTWNIISWWCDISYEGHMTYRIMVTWERIVSLTDVWSNDFSDEADASDQAHGGDTRGQRATTAPRVLWSAPVVRTVFCSLDNIFLVLFRWSFCVVRIQFETVISYLFTDLFRDVWFWQNLQSALLYVRYVNKTYVHYIQRRNYLTSMLGAPTQRLLLYCCCCIVVVMLSSELLCILQYYAAAGRGRTENPHFHPFSGGVAFYK